VRLKKTPGHAKSVSVAAGTALVTDSLTGLDFVDPATPALVGSGFLDGFSTDVVVQDSRGVWGRASDRLYIFHL
jgi:hypothetical protein